MAGWDEGGDCDCSGAEDEVAVSVFSLEEVKEVSGVSSALSSTEPALLPVASRFRVTPRSWLISSELRPFDSRKAILRSVGESRIDSSSRKRDAWLTRSSRDVDAGASSELGDGEGESVVD